tara:strand:+ start:56 stop:331 length:276 start_codon:yes stop_codon:yes gene_type:complete
MQYYLCGSTYSNEREGRVRDNSKLKIMECCNCGLVYLSSTEHTLQEFYEQSNIHKRESNKDKVIEIKDWLKETEIDDQRRFEMIKKLLLLF